MASIKVMFRPSAGSDGEGTIYYRIIHERKSRQLLSDYRLYSAEWDVSRSRVITSRNGDRRLFLLSVSEHIRRDVERLTWIICRLGNERVEYTADDVIDEYDRYTGEYSLRNFMERIIMRLKRRGKIRTSETYRATLNSFRKFLAAQDEECGYGCDGDIMLDCIDSEVMEAYEAWQRGRGLCPNTVSFYSRILRAVYNRAVEEGGIENRNPFRHVYTGVDKTAKRALPLSAIRRIKDLDLSMNAVLDYARDIFLLSFMLRGMSLIDMAYLRKSDRSGGYITYRRRKTGRRLTIEWTKEMQDILNKYPENKSDYLLPIIRHSHRNERSAYLNAGYTINHNLKKIAGMAGLSIPLTLYVARHSWASAARAEGIPLSVISEGMGHDSEATTQIYLAGLDTSVVDKANSIILRGLGF